MAMAAAFGSGRFGVLFDISFHQFETFTAVAKYGNVSQAAHALHVTPSAITHSIRRLEKACGIKLIRQIRRGVELTEAGEKILTQVELVLLLRNRIVNNADQDLNGLLKWGSIIGSSIVRFMMLTGSSLVATEIAGL
jgi:DNA-binding transcriptional LysR family regulator